MFGWAFGNYNNQPPEGGGGFFSGGTGNRGRFEQEYNCYPSSFLGRDDIDKGNKIILPSSALDSLARLNITNERDSRKSHCGVLEFVAEEGTCYLPYWLMQHLLLVEGDIVKVTNTSLPKGSFVKLQPVSKTFLDVHNPRAVLENSLRHFATLTKGDNIVINYNNKKFEIEIVETKPADAISIIEADIEVDFAPPKDYVEPPRPTPAATSSSQPPVQPTGSAPATIPEPTHVQPEVFGGAGYRLDGKAVKSGPPARGEHPLLQRMNGAAPVKERTIVTAEGAVEKTDQPVDKRDPDLPWKHRIPGGVKRDPPYGYLHLMEEHKK